MRFARKLGTEEGVTRRPVGKVTNIRRPGGKWQTSWRQVADILEVTRLLPWSGGEPGPWRMARARLLTPIAKWVAK